MLIHYLLAIHEDLKDLADLSVIIFLIPQLPSSSAKISFSNTLLISETTLHFTAKISISSCWPIYLGTLEFSHFAYTCRQTLQVIRKNFQGRISLQPQECGVTLVTVTNEPVPRSSTTFSAFSWGKHFFFSTSWKYQRVPIWLKTLNPKR